jgi:hydroxymethylpyrimidine/phosphomethylpyrimidine kinase
MRTALTIAGSDSSGGAGIQADLKTFAAHGVFGLSAITAITAQNTVEVTAVLALDPSLVTAQIDAVVTDLGAHATKVGMLANAQVARAVARALHRHQLRNVVLDTVMISKSRAALLDDDAIAVLRDELMPLADLITPNVPEAERLTGRGITHVDDLKRAAADLVKQGARAALVKGGHLDTPTATDVVFDGRTMLELESPRLPGRHTHGTGCTLSSAIAARLALGDSLHDAVRAAKDYVTRAIAQAPGLGRGHGPLQHFPK